MRYAIRKIVVGVASAHGDDPLLPSALELAERLRAELHLVHAFELHSPALEAYARLGYMDTRAPEGYAAGLRERMAAQVERLAPGRTAHVHAVAGPAGRMLQEVARQQGAELIVVGATRRGKLARALVGTTAQRTIRGAPCPVLVLKEPLPARLERVLLTTDLSPSTAAVHEVGLDVVEAVFRGDEPRLHSLCVIWFGAEQPGVPRETHLGEISRSHLADFLAERRDRGRPVQGVVRFGDPAVEIAEEAARWAPDLLVLGTHGRRGVQRLALGSISESAVRDVECSVLVVPPHAAEALERVAHPAAARAALS